MNRRSESSVFTLALIAALGIHGVLALLPFDPVSEARPQKNGAKALFEIDLAELAPKSQEPQTASQTVTKHASTPGARRSPSLARPPAGRRGAPSVLHADEPASMDSDSLVTEARQPIPGAAGTSLGEGEAAPSERKIDIGIDGPLPYLILGGGTPLAFRPKQDSDPGRLKQGLLQRDVAQGLGRAGPVAQLGRSITLEIGPQEESSALLSISFGKLGEVTQVALQEASSHAQDWQRVITAFKRMLRERPLKGLDGTGGYRVVLEIESRNRLPSGAKSAKPHLKNKGFSLGGQFDVADIGKNAQRVVVARIVREEAL